jgi:hypothetical protein
MPVKAAKKTSTLNSVVELVAAVKANAYKLQSLRFRTVYWCQKQGMAITLTQLPTLLANDGWHRQQNIEIKNSLIWANHDALRTLAYYNGEFSLEEHATPASFHEAMTNWRELVESGANAKGGIFPWTTLSCAKTRRLTGSSS